MEAQEKRDNPLEHDLEVPGGVQLRELSDAELAGIAGGWTALWRGLLSIGGSPSQAAAQMWLGTVTPEEGA